LTVLLICQNGYTDIFPRVLILVCKRSYSFPYRQDGEFNGTIIRDWNGYWFVSENYGEQGTIGDVKNGIAYYWTVTQPHSTLPPATGWKILQGYKAPSVTLTPVGQPVRAQPRIAARLRTDLRGLHPPPARAQSLVKKEEDGEEEELGESWSRPGEMRVKDELVGCGGLKPAKGNPGLYRYGDV
jgi:hypothetical protein